MNGMKKILFILGTARRERLSEKAANFVLEVARTRGDLEPVFLDVKDYSHSYTGGLDPKLAQKYNQLITEAAGIVIISPEYNHSFPGELKLLLDSAYQAYAGKTVAICSVSSGSLGGARMAEQLKLVLSAFQLTIINAAVYFTDVKEIFPQSGEVADRDLWSEKINGMLDEVLKYAR